MKISVITTAFNSAATIGYTIESFLEQSHRDAELIVIDGASRDRTAAIARSFAEPSGDPRIRVYSEPDRGIYDGMNKGLERFTGDAVGYLNSDDRYHDRHALATIAAALESHDAVCGNLDFVADHASRRVVRRWRGSPWRPDAFRRGWMPAHPTFYVRRRLAERVGRFDTGLGTSADYDFMLRSLELDPGVRVAFLDRVLVDMMAGGSSTAGLGAYLRGNLAALRSRRRWLGAGPVDFALFAKPLGKLGQWRTR